MCLFLLPLKINASIKQRLLEFGPKKEGLTTFSREVVYQLPGGEWDTLLNKCIKEKSSADALSKRMSALELSSARPSVIDVVRDLLISHIETDYHLNFLDSKFPLFGFMREREVATNEKKHHPKLYLWQGEADAIAYSWELDKYVIVEFKVVDNLSDYWQSKTDLYGKHLHQCLVYAKLLQLHMNLHYLPPILIVVIHKFTGKEAHFALFEDYPKECYEKLDEYEWFTEQPSKRPDPLKIASTDKLLHEKFRGVGDVVHVPDPQTKLSDIFGKDATVKDLLDSLGHDSLEIFRQEQ